MFANNAEKDMESIYRRAQYAAGTIEAHRFRLQALDYVKALQDNMDKVSPDAMLAELDRVRAEIGC
jgi:hypothetical protein